LPYFIRSESNERGAGPWHGDRGPVRVSDIASRHELIDAFIEGAQQVGVPRNDDFNGESQEGAGYYQLTTARGLRCSAATAYLKPARRRRNLTVLCEARATRLVIRNGRAVGVEYLRAGRRLQAMCDGEVMLCAGAVQSPQLLQLSGIGPASLLRKHGITVLLDAPGVGENLQDHLQVRLGYECARPITTNDQLNSWQGRIGIGWQWLLQRDGPLAIGINQGGCFMRALPTSDAPDIQFHVATLSADMAGARVHPWSGFTLSICQLRPQSRGHIRIRSADPLAVPEIQPNYLATKLDRATVVAAMKAARQIAGSAAMSAYVKCERTPGPRITTDAGLLQFARDTGATIFHPSGTSRMGPAGDAMAVLDERLRVRGLEALRVVDCSAMPTLISGNTNAPVIMMAEKAADMIRDDCAQGIRTSP
jgi:choline dehydrogenase